VVAVLGKINVELVFTLVTKATNVHVRPSVCTELPYPYETDVCEIPYRGGSIKVGIQKSILEAVGQAQDGLHKPDRIYDCLVAKYTIFRCSMVNIATSVTIFTLFNNVPMVTVTTSDT
jgi:hypothetical protein